MVQENGSSNTAIVAIIVIVLLIAAILYFMGVFGPRGERAAGERTNINIEQPTTTTPSRY